MKFEEPPIPDSINVEQRFNGIVILKTWRSWKILPLALFAIAWDTFLIFWYSKAFTSQNAPLMMILFPIGHVAVGVCLSYYVVASMFNVTKVSLDGSTVSVEISPIPWFPTGKYPNTGILDTRTKSSQTKNGTWSYEVRIRNHENRERKILGGLSDDEAAFLDWHIRKSVGLPTASSDS